MIPVPQKKKKICKKNTKRKFSIERRKKRKKGTVFYIPDADNILAEA